MKILPRHSWLSVKYATAKACIHLNRSVLTPAYNQKPWSFIWYTTNKLFIFYESNITWFYCDLWSSLLTKYNLLNISNKSKWHYCCVSQLLAWSVTYLQHNSVNTAFTKKNVPFQISTYFKIVQQLTFSISILLANFPFEPPFPF